MSINIDILCPTESRPEWMPWLAAQFNRLEWPHGTKRLVVVDSNIDASSAQALTPLVPKEALRIDMSLPLGEGLGSKRNRALDLVLEGEADLFTWMDDDDWYHPCRLTYMYERLVVGGYSQLVRGTCGYLDVPTGEFTLAHRKTSCWSLGLHRREVAQSARFEDVLYGEDNLWQRKIAHTAGSVSLDKLLMIVGKHDWNHTVRVAAPPEILNKDRLRVQLANGGLTQPYIEYVVEDLVGLRDRLGLEGTAF